MHAARFTKLTGAQPASETFHDTQESFENSAPKIFFGLLIREKIVRIKQINLKRVSLFLGFFQNPTCFWPREIKSWRSWKKAAARTERSYVTQTSPEKTRKGH
jgi:hypothetical protein